MHICIQEYIFIYTYMKTMSTLQFIDIFICGCYRNGRHHRKKSCHYLFSPCQLTGLRNMGVNFLSEVDDSCQEF